MCGIVGYVGKQAAGPILIDCLKRLEYRGYDSAGMGVIEDGRLQVRRSVGKVVNLERALAQEPLRGNVGIAHTRWATHGKPCDANAHPHRDCADTLAVVHNGMIENYRALKTSLQHEGHAFASETDTEVVAHLIEKHRSDDLEASARLATAELRGAYALGVINQLSPGKLLAIRSGGPPMVVGLAKGGLFVSSDISAILAYTRDVLILDDGEMAVIEAEGARLSTLDGTPVERAPIRVPWDAAAAERSGYAHFMLKEIHEQPRAVENTYRGRAMVATGQVALPELGPGDGAALAEVERVVIVACGTSYHAGLAGKQMIEALARVPVEVDVASEFRYRASTVNERTLTIAISQSGETADTLGAVRAAKAGGSRTLGISNVVGSSISRECDAVLYTWAGPEIGVASTKAFTTQLVALYLVAVRIAQAKGRLSPEASRGLLADLVALPRLLEKALENEDLLAAIAVRVQNFRDFLYLGRGMQHPLALEGALKLKEISYIHAEGYAAGEMKHGPIALIDGEMGVVVLAPKGRLYEKVLGGVEEVKARGGVVIAMASEGDSEIGALADHVVYLPETSELLTPILFAIPLQLLAYHVAVLRQCDVDQPRNLAKSVTVE